MNSQIVLAENMYRVSEITGEYSVATGQAINNQWLVENFIGEVYQSPTINKENPTWANAMEEIYELHKEAWNRLADL
jgi:hypothetical protein